MTGRSILWRRLDEPGHDSARVSAGDSGWVLAGTAVFASGDRPCRLDYRIRCEPDWRTRSAVLSGWIGERTIQADISVDSTRRWNMNGTDRPDLSGCSDLDISITPSTNLLPIRRLCLAIGEEAEITAAWLRVPEFTLEPLAQVYRRVGEDRYRFETDGGRFIRELRVNDAGFVTDYPGLWSLEAST